ncbi:hypothetical protein [Moraxella lacunata]
MVGLGAGLWIGLARLLYYPPALFVIRAWLVLIRQMTDYRLINWQD